jgi:penicillin-binding protein 1A
MKLALKDKPDAPFRVPPGIKLIRVSAKSGLRSSGGGDTILEAFKPGTAPPDSYAQVGFGETARPAAPLLNVDPGQSVNTGTGGGLF